MTNINELNQYARNHHVPIMMEDGLSFLIETVKNEEVATFLEIGTAIGKTAILVASLSPTIQVVTIERDPIMLEQAKKNIKDSGYEDQITLIEGDANTIELIDKNFDCIFIDAAKAQYQRFFAKYSPLLNPNGIIISDNMNFHGLVAHPENTHNRNTKALVRKIAAYRRFLENLDDFTTQFYDIGDGVALTRRNSK